MAEVQDEKTLLSQIEAKMEADLTAGQYYEAVQYVQSFVARKKRAIGRASTSAVVFLGAAQLVKYNAHSNAGSLLKWYIEDGAGAEHSFKINAAEATSSDYCDVQKVVELLVPLSPAHAFPVVDAVYGPLHLSVLKSKLGKEAPLAKRMEKFDEISAKAFLEAGKFFPSFKTYVRLNQLEHATNVLSIWASRGYPTEKPLFFGRALIYLLSENRVAAANELLNLSKTHIHDNIETSGGGGSMSASLAVWHVATVLTDLANFPPMPRVDKTKLFGILYNRYSRALKVIDPVLFELFEKAGDVVFEWRLAQVARGAGGPNPMAMLQGLFGASGQRQAPSSGSQQQQQIGGGGKTGKGGKNKGGAKVPGGAAQQAAAPPAAPGAPNLDWDQMMRMMASMNQQGSV